MNKIEKLIEESCPGGVPIVQLGELEDSGVLKLGRGNVISKTDLNADPGDYPVYSSSAVGLGEFGRYGKYMFDDERITWSVDGGGRFFYRPPHRYSVTNVCGWLKVIDEQKLNTRYLAHVLFHLWSSRVYSYTVKAHPSVIRQDYFVPLPPLKVQQEIVSILDRFTELEAELEAELETELEARTRQLEHFRELLLESGILPVEQRTKKKLWRDAHRDTEVFELGQVVEYVRGITYSKTDELDDGAIKVLRSNNISFESNTINFLNVKSLRTDVKVNAKQKLRAGDILISAASGSRAHVGKVAYIEEDIDYYFGGFMAVVRCSENLISKYLFHLLTSNMFRDYLDSTIESTTINNLNSGIVGRFKISLPGKQVQKEVVAILDALSEVLNGFQYGIPAEITARRQQYEYYRNKLLTFKELKAS